MNTLQDRIKKILESNIEMDTKIDLIIELCKKENNNYYYPYYPTPPMTQPYITYCQLASL
jgi:hypothetical protein